MNQIVNEIAEASNEQAQGVHEITSAMGQLDQVTQSNTNVAQQTSSFAENLNHQAKSVDHIVLDLHALVEGSKSESRAYQPEKGGKLVSFPKKVENPKTTSLAKKAAVGQSEAPSWDDPDFEDM